MTLQMTKSKIKNIIKEMVQHMDMCPEGMYFCKKDLICKPESEKIDHHGKHEGKMAHYDSIELSKDAMDVADMISMDTNLPEWVEAKITLAADYMNTVKDYLTYNMSSHNLHEKIGFRGPDYSDETIDLLQDFAKTGEMLNKEISKKQMSADDPLVQKILTLLDDNLSVDTDFLNAMQMVLDLIIELPDKPEKQKIGFKNE